MAGWLKALQRVLNRPKAGSKEADLLHQVQAADPAADEHALLRLLHVSLREQAKEAVDLALRRLEAHYLENGAREKRVSILTQLAHLHPDDDAIRADLEAAHIALGHAGDAARLYSEVPARGRIERVQVSPSVQPPADDGAQDTLPMEPVSVIDDADTEVDLPRRAASSVDAPALEPRGLPAFGKGLPVPNDPTAQVDPKTLDLLRRLSS